MGINEPASMIIRGINKDDLRVAAQCTSAEGWMSEDQTTLEGFFINDQYKPCQWKCLQKL
jgi:hypothetical protein